MHADQIDIPAAAVAGLVADQFPRRRTRPIRPLASTGTVNALFRLGDDIVLRFPLQPSTDPAPFAAEQDHARRIAPHVPLAVPEPLALGAPGPGYPGWWTAYRWIPGRPAAPGDAGRVARDLAGFVTALHRIDPGGRTWDGRSRGGPLAGRDDDVQSALAASRNLADTRRLAAVWAACRDAPRHEPDTTAARNREARPEPKAAARRKAIWPETDVWLHADLMPGNLLLRDGRLAAVIDLGAGAVGDPAVDLMPAWNLLPPPARAVYRRALGAGDAAWERGRGWAIVQAIVALPYYADSNPAMAATARQTLAAVLD